VRTYKTPKHFIIGHNRIDEEHSGLINALNEIINCINKNDLKGCEEKFGTFIQKFIDHDENEKKIMIDLNFKDSKGHSQQHLIVFQEIKKQKETCGNVADWEILCIKIFDHLVKTVFNHDLKFKSHLININYKP
jgi:hemerythrin